VISYFWWFWVLCLQLPFPLLPGGRGNVSTPNSLTNFVLNCHWNEVTYRIAYPFSKRKATPIYDL
jgi:hypothetical protein